MIARDQESSSPSFCNNIAQNNNTTSEADVDTGIIGTMPTVEIWILIVLGYVRYHLLVVNNHHNIINVSDLSNNKCLKQCFVSKTYG